jgi:hypothetical protein
MLGKKAAPTNVASCCESQATRTYGALPEFIYSRGGAAAVGSSSSKSKSTTSNKGALASSPPSPALRRRLNADGDAGVVAGAAAADDGDIEVVYVNLFVSSVYTSPGGGTTVVQNTSFPVGGDVSLRVASGAAALALRIPGWVAAAQATVQVSVQATAGGPVQNVTGAAGSYLKLPPVQAGGSVTATFPMRLLASVCVRLWRLLLPRRRPVPLQGRMSVPRDGSRVLRCGVAAELPLLLLPLLWRR